MNYDTIFLDKPLVTDDLDKPAPKKPYNARHDETKHANAARARRWSESIDESLKLPLHSSNNSDHIGR